MLVSSNNKNIRSFLGRKLDYISTTLNKTKTLLNLQNKILAGYLVMKYFLLSQTRTAAQESRFSEHLFWNRQTLVHPTALRSDGACATKALGKAHGLAFVNRHIIYRFLRREELFSFRSLLFSLRKIFHPVVKKVRIRDVQSVHRQEFLVEQKVIKFIAVKWIKLLSFPCLINAYGPVAPQFVE